MIIDVKQIHTEGKNEFEIYFNGVKIYYAKLPFLQINGAFNLDNLQKITIYDTTNNIKYSSNYRYIDNQIEEIIPLKYLVTGSQKFYQLSFFNKESEINIYFEITGIWNNYYIIKCNSKIYKCYEIHDGRFNHICIYDEDNQVGELLKPNVIIEGKDEYRIYLLDNYKFLADAISFFALYLDRTKYNSSYLLNKSKVIKKQWSYSKTNKFYDKNWIQSNFDANTYFESIEKSAKEVKNEVKDQFKLIAKLWIIAIPICIIIVLILIFILSVF